MKRVRELRQRKARQRTGLFVAEGIRLAGEAAECGAPIELCIVAPELLTSSYGQEVVAGIAARGTPVLEVTTQVFRTLSSREGPQGIAVVVRQHWTPLTEIVPGDELCRVVLDSAQDPGNIGSILRTSDAVGSAGIILVGDWADPFDPVAVRGSMGAVLSQQCTHTTWEDLAGWKAKNGVEFVGASDSAALNYRAATYSRPVVLVMGSERVGLDPRGIELCDAMVSIPMLGRSDSLNLAVATGLLLYELLYQVGAERVVE